MKLLLVLSIFLISCKETIKDTNILTKQNIEIIDKRIYGSVMKPVSYYELYVYVDGVAKWIRTDNETYRNFKIRDTITSYIITTTKVIKE